MRRILTEAQYNVLYRKDTEPAFSGKYCQFYEVGTYHCAACGNALFLSEHKFDCGSGWPSFNSAIPGSVKFLPDYRGGTHKTEVSCANCHSYLGYAFDNNQQPCESWYLINSLALDFQSEIS